MFLFFVHPSHLILNHNHNSHPISNSYFHHDSNSQLNSNPHPASSFQPSPYTSPYLNSHNNPHPNLHLIFFLPKIFFIFLPKIFSRDWPYSNLQWLDAFTSTNIAKYMRRKADQVHYHFHLLVWTYALGELGETFLNSNLSSSTPVLVYSVYWSIFTDTMFYKNIGCWYDYPSPSSNLVVAGSISSFSV